MTEPKGCGRGTTEVEIVETIGNEEEIEIVKERKNMIMVGRQAPDFTAPAYYEGEMTKVKLSDYKGKWVLLCFYPGDFTFV